MHQIDGEHAVSVMPVVGPVGPVPNGYFSSGAILENSITLPTMVDCDWANTVQEELCGAVQAGGIVLSKTDNFQLRQAIQNLINYAIEPSGLIKLEDDPDPTLGNNLIVNNHYIFNDAEILLDADVVDIQTANFSIMEKISSNSSGTSEFFKFSGSTQEFYVNDQSLIKVNGSGFSLSAGPSITTILNEDDMVSNSNTATFTQSSGKAYVDSNVSPLTGRYFQAIIQNADSNSPNIGSGNPLRFLCGYYPIVMPKNAVITDLRVICPRVWDTSATQPVVFTLRKNGVATALTLTIGLTNGTQDVTDSTHSVSFDVGDYVDIYATTTNASTIYLTYMDVSFKYYV